MGRTARSIVVAATALTAVAAVPACSSDDESPSPTVSVGTVTRTVARAGSSEAEKVAVVRLCQQVITSAGVMARDYNAFVKRLNQVQDYAKVGSEDRWAVDTLDTGAEEVRKAVSPEVPEKVDAQVEAFVASAERLAEQSQAKRRQALNGASDRWDADRTALLDTCAGYLPAGSA